MKFAVPFVASISLLLLEKMLLFCLIVNHELQAHNPLTQMVHNQNKIALPTPEITKIES